MATIQSFLYIALIFPIIVGSSMLGGLFALWGTRKYNDQLIGLLTGVALALVGIVFVPPVANSNYFLPISASLNWATLFGCVFLGLVPPRSDILATRTAFWSIGVSSVMVFLIVRLWI